MAETKQADDQTKEQLEAVAPGTVVTPGTPTPPAPAVPVPTPPAPTPPAQAEVQPPAEPSASQTDDPDAINWTASEFVTSDKNGGWYALLAMGTIAGAGLMYVITRDLVSVGVVILAAIILAAYGSHKPRQLQYRVDKRGITVGQKTYSYGEFQSFSLVPEGAFASITFMPLKRFAAPLSIYFAPDDGDKIVELISQQLPYEQRRRDAVDSLMRKIRF